MITYLKTNTNSPLVDSPFAKLASFITHNDLFLGIPPKAINSESKPNFIHQRAAEILELTSDDSEFVAARIRHLDFLIRSSDLANKVNWKSSMEHAWDSNTLFNSTNFDPIIENNGSLELLAIKVGSPTIGRLMWRFNVTKNQTTFTIVSSYGDTKTVNVANGASATTNLFDSGYNLRINNKLPNQTTVNATVKVGWPYSGNVVYLKNRILQNTDLIIQLLNNKPDFKNYFDKYVPVENVIAAFVIALDAV